MPSFWPVLLPTRLHEHPGNSPEEKITVQEVDSKSDSKATRKVRLTQYRKVDRCWQFVPVSRIQNREPDPSSVIVASHLVSWKSPGAKFYLDWMDPVTGKRVREIAGVAPREARDAWTHKRDVLSGRAEDDEFAKAEPDVHRTIEKFLVEVKATKGRATLEA
jgi:hypothetical protein